MPDFRAAAKWLLIVFVAFTALPGNAWALSCLAGSVERSYFHWSQSDAVYVIVRGKLKPLGEIPEKRTNTVEEQQIENLQAVPYIFKGVIIGKDHSSPVTVPVIVEPRCFAVWCGGYPYGRDEAVIALEKSEGGYFYRPTPCGGEAFYGDTLAHEEIVRNCMKNGNCS